MKIITLNTWGGRAGDSKILPFFEKYKDADIICLQEIYHQYKNETVENDYMRNLFSDIQKILTNHYGYFRQSLKDHSYGLALFVKKDISVLDEGDINIYEVPEYKIDLDGGNHPRNLQYVHFVNDNKEYTVANVHGLWNGMGKTDTEDRLRQSIAIKSYIDFAKGLKILCGDFNLLPDTESVSIIEKGMRNLIKEYGIISTRTEYYLKPDKYADYIFISPEIEVKNFQVLPDQVSDHAPLLLEI